MSAPRKATLRRATDTETLENKAPAAQPAVDLTIDPARTVKTLSEHLVSLLDESGFEGYIMGLTGGLDSAVAAAIATRAVGSEKLNLFCLPYKSMSHTVTDAQLVADWLGVKLNVIDISKMIDAYYVNPKIINPIRVGNKMARERMSILFDNAFDSRLLVLGHTNRTEFALGYFTWFGDAGCSTCLLGQLYKTQVRQLADFLGVPSEIQKKIPSADLWEGQTDEDELGFDYVDVDQFLALTIDKGVTSRKELIKAGIDDDLIDRAALLVNRYAFKRRCPIIPDLGRKPIPEELTIRP